MGHALFTSPWFCLRFFLGALAGNQERDYGRCRAAGGLRLINRSPLYAGDGAAILAASLLAANCCLDQMQCVELEVAARYSGCRSGAPLAAAAGSAAVFFRIARQPLRHFVGWQKPLRAQLM